MEVGSRKKIYRLLFSAVCGVVLMVLWDEDFSTKIILGFLLGPEQMNSHIAPHPHLGLAGRAGRGHSKERGSSCLLTVKEGWGGSLDTVFLSLQRETWGGSDLVRFVSFGNEAVVIVNFPGTPGDRCCSLNAIQTVLWCASLGPEV